MLRQAIAGVRALSSAVARIGVRTPTADGDSPRVPRKSLNRELGNRGEDAAVRELQRMGYRILARNYRCDAGEIDIIAEHRDVIVFVEVKARSPRALLPPEEAVDHNKRARIRNSAKFYLAPYRRPSPHRYDIVSVYLDEGDQVSRVEVHRAAFT